MTLLYGNSTHGRKLSEVSAHGGVGHLVVTYTIFTVLLAVCASSLCRHHTELCRLLQAHLKTMVCVQVRGVKDSKSKGKKKKAAEEKVAPLPMDQAGAGPALPRDLAAEDGLEVLEA